MNNHIPKPTLIRSLPIEQIPTIGSKWTYINNDVIYIKDVIVKFDKLFIKYNFINSKHSIYEKYTKTQFHKQFKKIDDN